MKISLEFLFASCLQAPKKSSHSLQEIKYIFTVKNHFLFRGKEAEDEGEKMPETQFFQGSFPFFAVRCQKMDRFLFMPKCYWFLLSWLQGKNIQQGKNEKNLNFNTFRRAVEASSSTSMALRENKTLKCSPHDLLQSFPLRYRVCFLFWMIASAHILLKIYYAGFGNR